MAKDETGQGSAAEVHGTQISPGWIAAPAHELEAVRLQELASLQVLDTIAEERFDRLTRLAADVFGVPISLVSLIDSERQWFKSHCGLDTQETPRDQAFCSHAILGEDVMVVEDATRDPRFRANPMVTGAPGIRFYAGAPLYGPSGMPLGTLCLIDREPRRLDARERTRLYELARIVEHELNARAQLEQTKQAVFEGAFLDPGTGLANRRLAEDRLGQAIAAAEEGGSAVTVIDVAMGGMEQAREVLGAEAAERTLAELAGRCRRVTPASATLARSGEAGLLLIVPHEAHRPELVGSLIEEVVRCATEPFVVQGRAYQLEAAVGSSSFPDDGAQVGVLLARAANARERARTTPGRSFSVHDQALAAQIRRDFVIAADLRKALDEDQFSLAYQPKVRAKDGQVVGVEALLRWQHPERGRMSPAEFVPIAEAIGLIHDLGAWVIGQAMMQAARWRRLLGRPLPVAINLSPHQLADPTFLTRFEALAATQPRPWELISLEVTESALFEDWEQAMAVLGRLRRDGYACALDDFGTGYSSLSYLRTIPISELKLDRSFLRGLASDAAAPAVIRAACAMGHALGMAVVAEGVETETERQLLYEQGVDILQGFLLGRPQSGEALEACLKAG